MQGKNEKRHAMTHSERCAAFTRCSAASEMADQAKCTARAYTGDGAETCVCCGTSVPEGRMVCPRCEVLYD